MKQVKKGFTLIEIAIVLVVIGLILGMVMKGRSLIDAAQLRTEVNKINKLQAAYTTYFSKYNRRPGTEATTTPITAVANSPAAVASDLLSEGMITEADFAIDMVGGFWSFTGCANVAAGDYWATKDLTASNICIMPTATSPVELKTATIAAGDKASQQFICYIETMIDDKNVASGQGRSEAAITDLKFTNCDKLSADADQAYSYRIY